jgi:hypothetical protein
MRHESLLDLGRVDVDPAGDDHVLDPVGDKQEAVGIAVADVAGPVEAVLDGVRAEGSLPEVVVDNHRGVDRNLAGLPGRQQVPLVVDDRDLDAVVRQSAGSGFAQLVFGRGEADHPGFAGAVDLPEEVRAALLDEPLLERLRDRGRPRADRLQRGQIVAVAHRARQGPNAQQHGRHRSPDLDPVLVDKPQG